jgi:glutathione synthase/RimK-type ligase-like ATP-grasp enzyme
MPRKPIAFLTMDCLDDFVVYDDLAKKPLAKRGWQVVDVSWRSKHVCWDDYVAVVVRTPWDYHLDIAAFLEVIETIERSSAMLLNSVDTIRWNVDKSYLQSFAQKGLAIVPTLWCDPLKTADLLNAFAALHTEEIVLKPTIGAGARDTFRLRRDDPKFPSLEALYRQRKAMIQPFIKNVVEQGEWSLFYFGDRYSHTVLKTPARGDFRVQEEHGSQLQAVTPEDDLLCLARSTLDAIDEPLVYARVDLVRLDDHTPAIMEVELIEPSLYFPYDVESPERFAEALDNALNDALRDL